MKKFILSSGLTFILPIFFIIIWSYLAHQLNNKVILPDFLNVVQILIHPREGLIGMGSLISNIIVSLFRVMLGYMLALLIALPLGFIMGYYQTVFNLANNFLSLFRPIPPLAWVPLVLAWFGTASMATFIGLEVGKWYVYLNNLKFSMLFIIFIGAFYPVLTSTIHGVKSVNKTLLDSARVLGAGEFGIFKKILLPAAAPSVFNGMRIGLGVAWMCLVSAEMLPGSLAGVGYLITHAYTIARTDIVIAGMASIGIVGALLDYVFRRFEERKFVWQRLTK